MPAERCSRSIIHRAEFSEVREIASFLVAFEDTFRFMRNRIAALINLPLDSIDQMGLGSKLRNIGAMDGSTSKTAGAALC